VVTYQAPNETNSQEFSKLRILHAEQDDFFPSVIHWVDRTILSGPDAPNFQAKTIKANVTTLGSFLLARYNSAGQPETVTSTDLRLEGTVLPASVNAGADATYTYTITNQSDAVATQVAFLKTLNPGTRLVSATSQQGACNTDHLHETTRTNNVSCHVGNIPVQGSITISIVVKVNMFGDGVNTTPVLIKSTADVSAAETDGNANNNFAVLSFNAIPSPNKPPTVSVDSPVDDEKYILAGNSVSIPITVSAMDADGSISSVKIYDTGEFVGDAFSTGSGTYTFNLNATRYGYHIISAEAEDNNGRTGSSQNKRILINSPHTLSIINPTQQLINPGAGLIVETRSSLAGPRLQKIELYDNGLLLGTLRAASNTGNLYTHRFNWKSIPKGRHTLTAVLTDTAGATTIADPVSFIATKSPTVTITSPNDSATFQSNVTIPVTVNVEDQDGYVNKIEFFANGLSIGSKDESITSGNSILQWIKPLDGIYSIVAVVTDDLGVTTTSNPVNIGVNRQSPSIGEMIWVDDNVPSGASTGGNDGWNWMNINPNSLLGSSAHQSKLAAGEHEHYFEGSSLKLQLNSGDSLSSWIFIDPDFVPAEIMLQWKDEQGWEHRAYWGDNLINLGTDGTNSRRRIGNVPASGRWVQLKVPVNLVGLEGKVVNGVKFTLHGGRAAWDRIGKINASSPPLPQEPDFVWVDDAVPPGSILEGAYDSWADTWITSNPTPHQGTKSHKHSYNDNGAAYRSRSFRNATQKMFVNPGDVLFTYVYLNSDIQYQPDSLILEWRDEATGWAHRAYWGKDFRKAVSLFDAVPANFEGWRYMGEIPARGTWVRLEIPASYVGLEGKAVDGMSFGIYKKNGKGRATWDYSGKTGSPATANIAPLKFTTPLWRFRCNNEWYYYVQNKDWNYWTESCTDGVNAGYTYSYPAPGTVPLNAWSNAENRLWVLNICPSCVPNLTYRGVVAHVATQGSLPEITSQKHYQCPETFLYTTFPEPPDNFTPIPGGCNFTYGGNAFMHTR
ncbi:MAG: Ig-like domain-containing protein, partial [Acidobacteriota bacterium]|nr:Ig-like domain-containing protein [Acidobacteriota bacterium]